MKTLKEQVEEIKNMKGSKSAKKAAIVKLGLRKYEVELLMAELPKPVRETHRFTFGVEIECLVAASLMRESAMRIFSMKVIITLTTTTIISSFQILLSEVKTLSNAYRRFLLVRRV